MKLLGLDPSIAAFGWGVIDATGRERRFVDAGTIRTKPDQGLEGRLRLIADVLGGLVRVHHCQLAACEELRFVNAGKSSDRVNADNSQSFLAAGAAFSACWAYGCRVRFVNPQRAKVAVLGPGGGRSSSPARSRREFDAQRVARKRAVRERLGALLGVELDVGLDASDALAFAWLLALERGRP